MECVKILIVCGEYFNESNGLSLSTQRFVRAFRSLGEEVRVLSSDHGGQFAGIMDKQNYHFAQPQKEVIRKALEWADLVHFEDPFPLSVQTAKMAYEIKIPMTGTFHLYPENMTASVPIFDFYVSNRNILYVFRELVYNYCYAVQCPTQKVKDRLVKAQYTSKMFVISNGIPEEYVAEKYPEKRNDLFTIISTGRYSNEKDQVTLIHAVSQSKYADKIKLILAGKGPLEDKYRELGAKLPNEPVLKFFSQEELRNEVQNANLYVHCANVEIEGMGCMEAFAGGTVPVIADSELSSTSAYALTEYNRYSAGNADELASRIDYWYENQDRLPEMGRKYLELASSLTVEKSAKKVLDMMRDALLNG